MSGDQDVFHFEGEASVVKPDPVVLKEAHPVSIGNDQMTPRPAPPKRRRGVGGELPSRIDVRLDQPLPPPPSFKDRRYSDDQGRRGKRQRFSDSTHERDHVSPSIALEDNRMQLTQYIARLADQGDAQNRDDDLFDMSCILVRDLRANRDQVIGILVECAVSQPLKQMFYAALIGFLVKNDENVALEVAETISYRLKQMIDQNHPRTVRMYLFFIASLVELQVFDAADLIANLVALIKLGIEAGPGSCRGDWAVYSAISTMIRSNFAVFTNEEIWIALRDYFLVRSDVAPPLPSVSRLSCLLPGEGDEFRLDRDTLQMVYTDILDAKASAQAARIHVIRAPGASIINALKRGTPSPLAFRFETLGQCGTGWLVPSRLHIDVSTRAKSINGLDAFVLEQLFLDQLYIWHEGGKESMMMLADRAIEFNVQQMLMEIILSQILDPNPCLLPPIYWRALPFWGLRANSTLAAFLGRSVHSLFQNLSKLTLDARERLASWFGFHLSNTSFEWPWPAWEHAATETDPLHPQRYFLQMALHQGVRLSYYDCIDDVLSPAPLLRSLLPSPMCLPNFTMADIEQRDSICSAIKAKTPFSDIMALAADSLELLLKCILWQGQKSYSHCFSYLRLYGSDIGDALQGLSVPHRFVGWIVEFWAAAPQHSIVIIDRLIRHYILNPEHIVSWIFNSYGSHKINDQALFTMLQNAALFAQETFDETTLSDLLILIVQSFAQLVLSHPEWDNILTQRCQMFLRQFGKTVAKHSSLIASEAFVDDSSRLYAVFNNEVSLLKKHFPDDLSPASMEDDADPAENDNLNDDAIISE